MELPDSRHLQIDHMKYIVVHGWFLLTPYTLKSLWSMKVLLSQEHVSVWSGLTDHQGWIWWKDHQRPKVEGDPVTRFIESSLSIRNMVLVLSYAIPIINIFYEVETMKIPENKSEA